MGDSIYLAMTAAELCRAQKLPERLAYMACHFSPYGTGISNCPESLPEKSLLILNDRTPIHGHDPALIARQLGQLVTDFGCCGALLDLQRPGIVETAALVARLVGDLPCPVGVSEHYAGEVDGPVFVSPVPLEKTPKEHLAPWSGREIWLDAATDAAVITVTAEGSNLTPLPYSLPPEEAFTEETLLCRYHTRLSHEQAEFFLYRTKDQLEALVEQTKDLGVTRAIGLYQQLA